jgi:zeta-carotene desaturase
MAAAVALESASIPITLIEARKTLGGRAGSFEDPQTGEILDNCQHVLLGCCTNLLDFYRRIEAADRIQWQDAIQFLDPRGKWHSLWAAPGLPAPFNLAMATMAFGALTFGERLHLARAMLAILRLSNAERIELADVSFGRWLSDHGQPESLIDKFYELVLVSALNETCRDASAAAAIQVFREGMLAHSSAYRMGTPACPLGELYQNVPCKDVRLGSRISALRFEGNRVTGVEMGDEKVDADAIVVAVNYPALEKWIPPHLYRRDGRFSGLNKLQSVPILGAHLWFDRPILDRPHAALMTGPLQWVFRKPRGDGSAVHGVISAARDWVGRDKDESLAIFTDQIRRAIPGAADAKLKRGVIVVEKRATFSPMPGVDKFRPPQAPLPGGIAGLFLAGDYTLTGWPATMEGAVRSGYLAAEGVLGISGKFLVPDLKPQWPVRLFGK